MPPGVGRSFEASRLTSRHGLPTVRSRRGSASGCTMCMHHSTSPHLLSVSPSAPCLTPSISSMAAILRCCHYAPGTALDPAFTLPALSQCSQGPKSPQQPTCSRVDRCRIFTMPQTPLPACPLTCSGLSLAFLHRLHLDPSGNLLRFQNFPTLTSCLHGLHRLVGNYFSQR